MVGLVAAAEASSLKYMYLGSYWGGKITSLSYYCTDLKFLQFLLTGRGSRGGGGDFRSFSSGA